MSKNLKKKPERKTCVKCEKSQPLGSYYNANSPFFPDNKMHMCKECALSIVEEKGFEGFQSLMRMINKPIYEDLYKGDAGDYIRQMNSLPQYRKVVFTDSDMFTEAKAHSIKNRIKPKELSEEDLRESEDFWGRGLLEEDYIWLNVEYSDYLNRYQVDGKVLENLIKQICLVELDISNTRAEGKDVKNLLKTLNELLGAASLRPNQESGNMSQEQETFGTFLKQIENERPLPDPDPMWQDVDNIGKYIRTFFLGHMAKMFGKENKFQDEYNDEIGKYTVTPPKDDD